MTHSTPNRKLLNTDKLFEEGRQTEYFGEGNIENIKATGEISQKRKLKQKWQTVL